jgi:Uma2 family endonuclease
MTVQLIPQAAIDQDIFYPESDGRPMAESDLHRNLMFRIIHLLQHYFAGKRIYVSGNLLIYYQQGNPRKSIAPDCFVVFGVEPRLRLIYKLWEEKQAPQVVFEVSSKSTQREDFTKKMRVYAQLGVQEYYIYDPTSEYLDPPLAAYELVDGAFVPMQPIKEVVLLGDWIFAPGVGDSPEFVSTLLGLRLSLDESNTLQFYDLATNARLLSDEERAQQAEAERQQAEAERQQAEAERQQAEERASLAELEVARLRDELARLRAGLH